MKHFLQFLQERFYKGVNGRFGYVEIFKNPTLDEIESIVKHRPRWELGGIAAKTDLYVWDRVDCDHTDAKRAIGTVGVGWIPLYLYYDSRYRSVEVVLAKYTAERLDLSLDDDQTVALMRTHPAFKIFTRVNKYE